jgi:crotonobetainyl-CoA:carnitine CoA-transferase CaiB-like acyl-CoA transferase
LEIDELAGDEHLAARGTVRSDTDGLTAAPAPRLSAHPGLTPRTPSSLHSQDILVSLGLDPTEVGALIADGVVADFEVGP